MYNLIKSSFLSIFYAYCRTCLIKSNYMFKMYNFVYDRILWIIIFRSYIEYKNSKYNLLLSTIDVGRKRSRCKNPQRQKEEYINRTPNGSEYQHLQSAISNVLTIETIYNIRIIIIRQINTNYRISRSQNQPTY